MRGSRFILFFGGLLGSAGGGAPPGDAPTLQFNVTTNSQLLALLEDF
jgi:hypothetical protein